MILVGIIVVLLLLFALYWYFTGYTRYKSTDSNGPLTSTNGINMGVKNIDDCQKLCDKEKSCRAYVYNNDREECYLKSKVGEFKEGNAAAWKTLGVYRGF